jgi:DNA-binding MarR family transcriptional regulator
VVAVDQAAQRDLKILTEIAERGDVTQRGLAKSLGIALGLTNLYLKRLARKGYIKVTTIPRNRIRYLLTPKGLAQKTRLTYEFMEYSLHLYRQTRHRLREVLEPLHRRPHPRVALYGTDEAAELAYLTLRELGMDLTAVVDGESGDRRFIGLPVRRPADLDPDTFDVLLVATFTSPDAIVDKLVAEGIPRDKVLPLRRPPE